MLWQISKELQQQIAKIKFSAPVTHVYAPLEYAASAHKLYLERFGQQTPREIVLVGMNPGPWGMIQTGVPFGEVKIVRDWLGINTPIGRPAKEHPQRPVEGFACQRSEVSGLRVFGLAKQYYGTAANFFKRFFILNYCPLGFFAADGRNITPDQLKAEEKEQLLPACDAAVLKMIEYLQPRHVLGIGQFVYKRLNTALTQALRLEEARLPQKVPLAAKAKPLGDVVGGRLSARELNESMRYLDEQPPSSSAELSCSYRLGKRELQVWYLLHPSPANPKANQNWILTAKTLLDKLS